MLLTNFHYRKKSLKIPKR